MLTKLSDILLTLNLTNRVLFNETVELNNAKELVRKENAQYLLDLELAENEYYLTRLAQ